MAPSRYKAEFDDPASEPNYLTRQAVRLYWLMLACLTSAVLRIDSLFTAGQLVHGHDSWYTYRSLRQHSSWRSYRVILLDPGDSQGLPLAGRLVTNVVLTLFSRDFSFGYKYEAVSYCWGQSSPEVGILIDGKELLITKSLAVALQHLRLKGEPRALWIDQICICQSNDEDKSQQVQQMNTIYSEAQSVTVWLGPATKESSIVLARGDWVSELKCQEYYYLLASELEEGHKIRAALDSLLYANVEQYGRPLLDADEWRQIVVSAYFAVLANSWFRRMWIVQEAVLPTQLYVQAGSHRLPWKWFIGIRDLFIEDQHTAGRGNEEKANLDSLLMAIERRRLGHAGEDPDQLKLRDLVLETAESERESSNPRDRIYALRGISTNPTQTQLSRGSKAFTVDYTKSVQEVFMDFTVWCLKVYPDLEIIRQVCGEDSRRMTGLPSWTLDFAGLRIGQGAGGRKCHPLVATLINFARLGYRACGDRTAQPRFLPPKILLVQGVIIDEIAEVSPEGTNKFRAKYNEDVSSMPDWKEWKDLALENFTTDPYGGPTGRIDALWRTLVCDLEWEDGALPAGRVSAQVGKDFATKIEPLGTEEEDEDSLGHWLSRYGARHTGRKLFCTKRGLLGISCKHIQKGDKVIVLFNGDLPFLLREAGPTTIPTEEGVREQVAYRMIGGYCYIHGLADGEGVDIARREAIQPSEICLI